MWPPLIFRGIDAGAVDEVLAGARKRTFERGDIVFHEGDPGDSMQVVAEGHFALRIVTPSGDVCMTKVFGQGEMFGRIAFGPLEAVREATIVSLEPSRTYELFRHQIDELRAKHPSVNEMLIATAGLQLRQVAERLLEALFIDADRRVRRRLLELGNEYRDEAGLAAIPLTQEDLAALAGTSRATVSRVLADEERRGTIMKRRRNVVLLDEDQLTRLARWPSETEDTLGATAIRPGERAADPARSARA